MYPPHAQLKKNLESTEDVRQKFSYLIGYLEVRLMPITDQQQRYAYRNVIHRCESMYYSDFESPIGCPKIAMKTDLDIIGEPEVAQFVVEGLFDG